DADGDTDLVCHDDTLNTLKVYRNQHGVFTPRDQTLPDLYAPDNLHAADIDSDGLPDLFGNLRSGVAILRNRGDCSFRLPHTTLLSNILNDSAARRMTTGDLDGDGDLDAVVLAGSSEGAAVVLRNQSNGVFTALIAEAGADGE